MKIPSEAELIEMERRFRFLLEISRDLQERAGGARRNCVRYAHYPLDELETNAAILEAVFDQSQKLIDMVRAAI